jgi:hypothetical protein
MGINIPIVTDFDGKGIKKAIAQFKQLETTSEKAQFAIKKAAVPAAAAVGALAIAMGDAAKAAIEDEQAQQMLARQLKASTGATDAQVKAVEDYISKQGKLTGITDDELRPAMAGLVRATKDVNEAQRAANLAQDIAAAKGVSLETVTKALERAYGGNLGALAKLDPSVRELVKSGASLEEIMATLGGTFGGAAEAASNTAAGGFKKLQTSLNETKESIGAALLPVIQKVLPYLQKAADWAQDNPKAFTIIAGTIAAVATAIMAVNVAMALNPFGLIAIAIGAIITAVTIAYTKFEGFRTVVKSVVNGVIGYFEFLANSWIKTANTIIRGLNIINPFGDIKPIDSISLGRIGEGGSSRSTKAAIEAADMASASAGATATAGLNLGSATAGTSSGGAAAKVAAVVPKGPDGYVGPMGLPEISLGNLSLSQVDVSLGGTSGATAPVNVYATSANPDAVVEAIVEWTKRNGALPISVQVA